MAGAGRILCATLAACPVVHADGAGVAHVEGPVEAPRILDMLAGETRVLSHRGVTRVAVGDGKVLQALAADGREVIVFARAAGESSLHVWAAGRRSAYHLRVLPAGTRSARAEIDTLLARIPGARGIAVGEHVVIEGNDLSDADQERVAALAQRYPQVLDFTGKVGWDRMVQLDVQVVELPRTRLSELGLRWDGATEGGLHVGAGLDAVSSGRLQGRPGAAPLAVPLRSAPLTGYVGLNAVLGARLNLLAQSGDAVILAQPQLLARSGATAEFLAGGEVPYATTDRNGQAKTMFKPYGVSLRITPSIAASGAVRSRIEVEASSVDATLPSAAGPALKTRRAVTEFNVRSGHTLVIGGFLSRNKIRATAGLPMLSELPWIGGLFGSRRDELQETELAIFVTPTVVSGLDPGMRETIRRGQAVLRESFDTAPRLLAPYAGVAPSRQWDPFRGDGSQWDTRRAQAGTGAGAEGEASHAQVRDPYAASYPIDLP
ncbi:secretion protein [Achromobacter aloeverae]|uniref:Secretion protein n=2 Tax=Achromobacter aloeverae TaxID=1750518 RepID=A0A4Q1HR62_9BURK|nr:secretion protein [Achromobacter aloeverae]